MMELDPRASAAGVRLVSHELLPSSNSEALALARAGERGPLWVTAGRQSAGRGRRGRTWVSEPGNLFASLLLTEPAPPEHWAELSLVAALAIHDAIADLAPGARARLAIKWPNDLLLDGAKFAGILTEAEGDSTVVVGIGVNCATHPAETDYPATNLAAGRIKLSPQAIFIALSAKMLGRLAQWNQGEHFATIRTDWLSRAAGLGDNVTIRLSERELTGRFETIDDLGQLVLVEPEGTRYAIAAGDVVKLRWSGPGSGEG